MHIAFGNLEKAEAVVRLVFADDHAEGFDFELRDHMKKAGAVTWFFGRRGEQHALVIGLGERATFQWERLREAAGEAGRAMEQEQLSTVGISFASLESLFRAEPFQEGAVTTWVEGWLLGTYTFDRYKSSKAQKHVQEMILDCAANPALEQAVQLGRTRAGGTILARDLVNEPPNMLTPDTWIKQVEEHFKGRNVQLSVYRDEQLRALQMNGLLTVGKGSAHPPALLEIRYCTDPTLPLLALIGKGITFDMGGNNVKTGRDISDARMDMGGGAAVIGAMEIITSLQIRGNIVALIALAENVPDGAAFLPSDVISYPNGLTVQVVNTDAEGRLVLADALLHAGRLGAQEVIDIATLTGNIGEALGLQYAGIWGDRQFVDTLVAIGQDTGDRLWPMPLVDEYEPFLKSDYADLANLGSTTYGGAIMAALFLRRFVSESMRWVHIDMAPPVQAKSTAGYQIVGATGYGARLLADFVQWRSSPSIVL